MALLRMYNDIATTAGKSNGSFIVLLNLSAVGIGGSTLRLIRSYFSDRT